MSSKKPPEKKPAGPPKKPEPSKPAAPPPKPAAPPPTAFEKWECQVCGYIYDESKGDVDGGIKPGTKFKDLPDDWVCPMCGASKDEFQKVA
ncbi:MAG: hypothetical protein C4K49_05950 [Candidatus Thorarchaeota archaeon]|nr:MAG: hypothetical protein C4K49_05950 [Candidatus Thorarchaeota archaeon]